MCNSFPSLPSTTHPDIPNQLFLHYFCASRANLERRQSRRRQLLRAKSKCSPQLREQRMTLCYRCALLSMTWASTKCQGLFHVLVWIHQAFQANRELFALLYFKNKKPLAAVFQPGNVRLIFKDPGTNYASFIDPLGSTACLFTNVNSIFFSVKWSWIG